VDAVELPPRPGPARLDETPEATERNPTHQQAPHACRRDTVKSRLFSG
jgi:hypothetical protein